MRRFLLSLSLLGVLGAVAVAEPARDPEPPANPPTPAPKKLQVGTEGLFQPGLLAQGWFITEVVKGNATLSTFRLRRAEIYARGEILPKKVAYQIMFDPAKVRESTNVTVAGPPDSHGKPTTITIPTPSGSISVLQDFYITFLSSVADVSIGQFKIPVSWEGFNSSAKLLLPERAIVSALYGDKRDLGVRAGKQFTRFGYVAGIYNGQGANNLDTNNQKDLALRLETYPVVGMTIAGVVYDSVGYRSRAGTKDRWEVDVRYELGPFLLQSELIAARDVKKDNVAATKELGYYVLAGYMLKTPSLHGDLQPIFRIGYYDGDTTKNLDPVTDKDDELYHYDVGVNYYVKGNEMKLQAAYQYKQYQSAPGVQQLIVAAQVWY